MKGYEKRHTGSGKEVKAEESRGNFIEIREKILKGINPDSKSYAIGVLRERKFEKILRRLVAEGLLVWQDPVGRFGFTDIIYGVDFYAVMHRKKEQPIVIPIQVTGHTWVKDKRRMDSEKRPILTIWFKPNIPPKKLENKTKMLIGRYVQETVEGRTKTGDANIA